MEKIESPPHVKIHYQWSFRFNMQTSERTYELMAASDDERHLWMYAINWIITEQKKFRQKQLEIKKTTERFKNLPPEKKSELLAKTMEKKLSDPDNAKQVD